MGFSLTHKQLEAQRVMASDATHVMLFGGSRSGKTFLIIKAIVTRALKAANSRHGIFRFRFNAIKASVVLDTFPKVMALAFPGVTYSLNKTDFYATFSNGSEIWFAGLDDKERTEKVLGMEFVTLYFNESSQIPYSSIEVALSRLAQKATQKKIGNIAERELKTRAYYDLNPTSKNHWSYRLFVEKKSADGKTRLDNPEDYAYFQINPADNVENLSDSYLKTLNAMSAKSKIRFLAGQFADAIENALFQFSDIETYRNISGDLPQFTRVVVGVDPSGASDENSTSDAIGIVVGGIGVDGKAYLLEDCTVVAGPKTWGQVATTAYDRHQADCIVGEINFGGGMVKHVIQTSRPRTPFKSVTASRGKHVRAEPFSALYEQGRVVHVGYFPELEDEICEFSTTGYLGDSSPNRADAWFWVLTELFGGIVKPAKKSPKIPSYRPTVAGFGY